MPIIASIKRYTPIRAKRMIRRMILPSQTGRNFRVDSPPEQPAPAPPEANEEPETPIERQKIEETHWALKYLEEQGHERSFATKKPVDRDGKPLPWYTYPAIEYLQGIDWSTKRVLEFGSGHSSLFWAGRVARIWSVESDESWHADISPQMPSNATLDLRREKDDYIHYAQEVGGAFDLIIVDGVHRLDCVKNCLPALAEDGLLIFDNSDWHPQSTQRLREAGLIQMDFTGLGPINQYAWTTSLFPRPQFRPRPLQERLPLWGVGALQQFANPE